MLNTMLRKPVKKRVENSTLGSDQPPTLQPKVLKIFSKKNSKKLKKHGLKWHTFFDGFPNQLNFPTRCCSCDVVCAARPLSSASPAVVGRGCCSAAVVRTMERAGVG